MRKKKSFFLFGSIAVILFIAFFLYMKLRSSPESGEDSPEKHALRITPEPSREDHVLWEGSDRAVVVEYFDIDCKYCRALFLKEDQLPDNIKKNVRLIYRLFPLLDLYPRSLERAIIAECVASESGDSIFFDFLRSVTRSYQQDEDKNDWIMNIANQFVSDHGHFQECVSKKLTLEKINRFRTGGYDAGIFSVPSFLVAQQGMPVKRFDLLGPITGSNLLKAFADVK